MLYQYDVCDACSIAMTNDDWSAHDPEHLDTITSSLEAMGWVCPAGQIIDGYLDCWICDEICIDGQVWESMLETV